MGKVWKDIPGYEGYYQASSIGEIRSLDRSVMHYKGGISIRKGRMLKPGHNIWGYEIVVLSKNNVKKSYSVHRLVMISFIGDSMLDVDHINGCRTDNRIENLRYCSDRDNATFSNRRDYLRLTSKLPGVHFNKNNKKWIAQIMLNNKQVYLGSFTDERLAAAAYQNKLEDIIKA